MQATASQLDAEVFSITRGANVSSTKKHSAAEVPGLQVSSASSEMGVLCTVIERRIESFARARGQLAASRFQLGLFLAAYDALAAFRSTRLNQESVQLYSVSERGCVCIDISLSLSLSLYIYIYIER